MKLLLLIVTLALEPGAIYLGFFAKRILFRWYSQAAAFLLPLLSLALAYALWQEATAVQRLSVYIEPYPRIASALWVPPIPGSGARHWISTTRDGREALMKFYTDEPHRRGWVSSGGGAGGYLLLRKGTDCLDNFASENALATNGRETTVIYTLRESCAAGGRPRSKKPSVLALTTVPVIAPSPDRRRPGPTAPCVACTGMWWGAVGVCLHPQPNAGLHGNRQRGLVHQPGRREDLDGWGHSVQSKVRDPWGGRHERSASAHGGRRRV